MQICNNCSAIYGDFYVVFIIPLTWFHCEIVFSSKYFVLSHSIDVVSILSYPISRYLCPGYVITSRDILLRVLTYFHGFLSLAHITHHKGALFENIGYFILLYFAYARIYCIFDILLIHVDQPVVGSTSSVYELTTWFLMFLHEPYILTLLKKNDDSSAISNTMFTIVFHTRNNASWFMCTLSLMDPTKPTMILLRYFHHLYVYITPFIARPGPVGVVCLQTKHLSPVFVHEWQS